MMFRCLFGHDYEKSLVLTPIGQTEPGIVSTEYTETLRCKRCGKTVTKTEIIPFRYFVED